MIALLVVLPIAALAAVLAVVTYWFYIDFRKKN